MTDTTDGHAGPYPAGMPHSDRYADDPRIVAARRAVTAYEDARDAAVRALNTRYLKVAACEPIAADIGNTAVGRLTGLGEATVRRDIAEGFRLSAQQRD